MSNSFNIFRGGAETRFFIRAYFKITKNKQGALEVKSYC